MKNYPRQIHNVKPSIVFVKIKSALIVKIKECSNT